MLISGLKGLKPNYIYIGNVTTTVSVALILKVLFSRKMMPRIVVLH